LLTEAPEHSPSTNSAANNTAALSGKEGSILCTVLVPPIVPYGYSATVAEPWRGIGSRIILQP
jgi:hypothetical protein